MRFKQNHKRRHTHRHTHTSAPLFLFFLLRELVKWKVVEVQAIDVTGQHDGQGVHDAGPLDHQLLPVAERGQHCQQVIPQFTRDEHTEIGPHPCHNDGLKQNSHVRVQTTAKQERVCATVQRPCSFTGLTVLLLVNYSL